MKDFTIKIKELAKIRYKLAFPSYIERIGGELMLSKLKLLFPLSGNNSFYILDVNPEWDTSCSKNKQNKWKVYFPLEDALTDVLVVDEEKHGRFDLLMYDGIFYCFDNVEGILFTDCNAINYRFLIKNYKTCCGLVFYANDIRSRIKYAAEKLKINEDEFIQIIKDEFNITSDDNLNEIVEIHPYRNVEENENPLEKFIRTDHFSYKIQKGNGGNYEIINYYYGKILSFGDYLFTCYTDIFKMKQSRKMLLLQSESFYGSCQNIEHEINIRF